MIADGFKVFGCLFVKKILNKVLVASMNIYKFLKILPVTLFSELVPAFR